MSVSSIQPPEDSDLEVPHVRNPPSTNFYTSTKLDLTTKPPLLGRCCSRLTVLLSSYLSFVCALALQAL